MSSRKDIGILISAVFAGCLIFGTACNKDPFDSSKGSFKDTRDSHSYSWAKIGTQIWMTENLAFLPSVNPSELGSDTDVFYYVYDYESTFVNTAKATPNYQSYGVLYNWPSATKACPDGWHLPLDAEWNVLTGFLGGDSLAGHQMKSKSGWFENGNGDNSSGFNGTAGGYRDNDGGFFLLGKNAGYWTATNADSTNAAFVRDLGYNYEVIGQGFYNKRGGFSVRCVRN